MTDLTIHSVCSKKQVYPMILNFQNGCPSENFQFECVLLQDERGSNPARNKITDKVRLMQAGTATLNPLNDYSILEKVLEPDKTNYTLTDENKIESNTNHSHLLKNEVDLNRPNHALPAPNQTNQPQNPVQSNLKPNPTIESKILPNRTNSLSLGSASELNGLVESKQCIHMLDTPEKGIQTEEVKETDETSTIDITTELSRKYDHILNYYHEELYEQDVDNLKGRTGEHKKLRKKKDKGFSTIKEMFVKGLRLNIKVGEKRKKRNVMHTTNNLEINKMTVDNNPVIIQKIGKMDKEDDNEAQSFGDDFNTGPLESKTNIPDFCKSTHKTNCSLSVSSDSELNRLIVSEKSIHMPDILEEDIQMEEIKETDGKNTIDITTKVSSKYNHIMNYYHDELYESFDEHNFNRKTGEHEKPRRDNDECFSVIKEMFVKALGLNIKDGEKRKKQNVVHTANNLESNKITVDNNPAIIQTIGNLNENDDNEAQSFGDDFNIGPLESKTYICGCCNRTFEDKGAIVFHLISHKFMRNANKDRLRPIVKRLVGNIKSNDVMRKKQYKHIEKNINNRKSSEKTKNNGIRFCDEDNATAYHDALIVSGNKLIISDDRQNMQIFHNEIESTDNFKDSNDDCPIHLAEDFELMQNQLSEIIFICDHCEKAFGEKGSLIFHLLAHKFIIEKKSRGIISKIKQKHIKNGTVKANDLKPKSTNEQNEKNIRTDIHKDRNSEDSKVQDRVLTRSMNLAAQRLLNDTNIRKSKTVTTDNETLQEHEEIVTLHEPKVNEDEENMGPDREDRNSNVKDNVKQTNRVTTRSKAQMKNHGNIRNSNKNCTTNNGGSESGRKFKRKAFLITHTKSHSNKSTTKAKTKVITLKPHTTPMNDSKKWSSKLKEQGIELKFPIIKLENCNMSNHLEKNTKNTKFCTLCKYETPYASRLARHMKGIHTKSNKCGHCKKEFRQKHDLIFHLRTHSGDRPFRCQCGSSFARMDTLNRHLKTHTTEKPYKCTLCPSKFKIPSGLKRHLKIHAEKTYKCTTCASSFSDGSSLKRHLLCHILKKPYSCERCKYSSAYNYDLKRHAKTCEGRANSWSRRVRNANRTP